MDDIKSQLNGRSRKDLLASLCFLQEGILLLCCCLDQSGPGQEEATDPTPEDQVETSRMSCVAQSKAVSDVLEFIRAKEKLETGSRFKHRIKDARERAAQTFYHMVLSIADRILATKCRVISSILENLDSSGTAILSFLLYLRDLHSLPDVCEIFPAYLNRTKSLFGNDERIEIIIKSVMFIGQRLLNSVMVGYLTQY